MCGPCRRGSRRASTRLLRPRGLCSRRRPPPHCFRCKICFGSNKCVLLGDGQSWGALAQALTEVSKAPLSLNMGVKKRKCVGSASSHYSSEAAAPYTARAARAGSTGRAGGAGRGGAGWRARGLHVAKPICPACSPKPTALLEKGNAIPGPTL